MNFGHLIVKIIVDPRGDSRVEPQTSLSILWRIKEQQNEMVVRSEHNDTHEMGAARES